MVALSVAVLLSVALIYTSFTASTEAKEPSQLLSAAPGTSYDMTGTVVPGSVRQSGDGLRFRVADREGEGREAFRSPTAAPSPIPFRGGREIVLTGEVQHGDLRRAAEHPGHQVPVEVHRPEADQKNDS